MSSIIIIVFVISGMIALKKPIIGAISGSILTILLFFILNDFEIGQFLVTCNIGNCRQFCRSICDWMVFFRI